MKTLAIMFFILTVINLPLYVIYSRSTQNNDYENFKESSKYFMLGNIATTNKECSHYSLDFELSKQAFSGLDKNG